MGYRFLNIFLAAVIFISSIGVTVNRHYCQKQLRSTALWSMPKSCHETVTLNDKLPSCPFHAKKSDTEKRNCCSEESEYVKTETPQYLVFDDILRIPTFEFDPPTFCLGQPKLLPIETDYAIYCFHPPPDKIPLRILYQNFLI